MQSGFSLQVPFSGQHIPGSKLGPWKSSGAAGARKPDHSRNTGMGADAVPGENSQQWGDGVQAGPMDFAGEAGKGNDSKLKGKANVLKDTLPAAEVYWVLWVLPGPVRPQLPNAEEIDSSSLADGLVMGFRVVTGQLCNLLLSGQSNTAFPASFRVFEPISEGA